MTFTRYLIYTVLLLSLMACSQYSTIQTTDPAFEPQPSSSIPEYWQITAKLGIRSPDEGYSLTTVWQQQDDQYDIRLTAPLGQGSGRLKGDNDLIAIFRTGQPTLFSDAPADLVSRTYGWPLPLEHLSDWIRGLKSRWSTPQWEIKNEQNNTLLKLKQEGWKLNYSRYKLVDKWLLPHRIKASKEDTHLTLVIKQWEFPQPL